MGAREVRHRSCGETQEARQVTSRWRLQRRRSGRETMPVGRRRKRRRTRAYGSTGLRKSRLGVQTRPSFSPTSARRPLLCIFALLRYACTVPALFFLSPASLLNIVLVLL